MSYSVYEMGAVVLGGPRRMSRAALQHMLVNEGKGPYRDGRYWMYNDPSGHCTIGVGHLVHLGPCAMGLTDAELQAHIDAGRWDTTEFYAEVPYRNGLTLQEVEDLFAQDVGGMERVASRKLGTMPVTQDQFDSLVSFLYNVGPGRAQGLGLWEATASGNPAQVAEVIATGPTGGGHPGLVRRRREEAAPWLV